jgi:hypothetical protein
MPTIIVGISGTVQMSETTKFCETVLKDAHTNYVAARVAYADAVGGLSE